MSPPESAVALALMSARRATCRNKRGVVVYRLEENGIVTVHGSGWNGPPEALPCPGREVCAGTCGQRAVHAEMRALRQVTERSGAKFELLHVELAGGGGVAPCDGPACWQCSREILDVGFIAGVWLYEETGPLLKARDDRGAVAGTMRAATWRRYTAEEFHRVTLQRCGMVP